MNVNLYVNKLERGNYVTTEPVAMAKVSVTGKQAAKGKKKDDGKDVTIPADGLALRRRQAQRQAVKILQDAFAFDEKMNQSIADKKKEIADLKNDSLANHNKIGEIDARRQDLMESYGITEESEEYQDLELLRKERKSRQSWSGEELTEEEQERLAQIKQKGMTPFQKEMLEMDGAEEIYQTKIEKNSLAIKMGNLSLSAMESEQLKQNPMVEAGKQADAVMEAANKEIIGELYAEGKKKLDEEKEKLQEIADEKKEEEEKKEELETEREEREEKEEELIHDIQENNLDAIELQTAAKDTESSEEMAGNFQSDQIQELQKKMEAIQKKLKLLEEDMKGMAVDVSF